MKVFLFIVLSLLSTRAFATVHHVPGQFSNVQNALNSCSTGDTVLVQPGFYLENILWPQVANIKLLSAGDSSNTVLDGSGISSVIFFSQNPFVNNYTIIKGFTFQNAIIGLRIEGGGPYFNLCAVRYCNTGVTAYNSFAVFVNVSIYENISSGATQTFGVGMHIEDGNVMISKSVIRDNKVLNSQGYINGVGVYLSRSHTMISRTKIINNFADTSSNGNYFRGCGVFIENYDSSVFTNVLIAENTGPVTFFQGGGSAIYIKKCFNVRLINCTVAENHLFNAFNYAGEGIRIEEGSLTITNSIIWNIVPGTVLSATGSSMPVISVTYSDIKGGFSGISNINNDPLFTGNGSYSIQLSSPCVNAGTLSGAPLNDINSLVRPLPAGTNPDLGAYEVNQGFVSLGETPDEINSWSIYSAHGNIFIHFENPINERGMLKLFSMEGKLIYTEFVNPSGELTIELPDRFSSGVYLAALELNGKIYSRKFISDVLPH